VKRKGVKRQQRQAEPKAANAPDTLSLLPMEIQIGDRFTDQGFEWQVMTRPAVLHGGKSLRARVQRAGLPETERDMTWPAHVRFEVRRHPNAQQLDLPRRFKP
jgi:hypothetical protein